VRDRDPEGADLQAGGRVKREVPTSTRP
jgi:hypothetical protein